MKQTYINPMLTVVKINTTRQVLTVVSGFNDQLNTTGNSGDKALGRGFDFDDEE